MAIPTYSTALSQINTYIVANGNNEITANVLNPVLKVILDFASNNIGDLDTLTTDQKNTVVASINSLKQNFADLANKGVQLHLGYDEPNTTPPIAYNYADFYMQLDSLDDSPVILWQWNGFSWVNSPVDHFKGKFTTLLALQLSVPAGIDGDYAIVDSGVANNAKEYIWDSEEGWVEGGGGLASNLQQVLDAGSIGSVNKQITIDAGSFGSLDFAAPDSGILMNSNGGNRITILANNGGVLGLDPVFGAVLQSSSNAQVAMQTQTFLNKVKVQDSDGVNLTSNLIIGLTAPNVKVKLGTAEYIFDPSKPAGTYTLATTSDISGSANKKVWDRKGMVLKDVKNGGGAGEPSIIREGSPQILTTVDTVFKMWYTNGWTVSATNYAESADGVNWTEYASNPVLTGKIRNFVIKNAGTYIMYCTTAGGEDIDRYTSTNGLTWTLANAGVIVRGTAGTWNSTAVMNMFVWIEGAVWYMMLEGNSPSAGSHNYKLGVYTSSDGITWTANIANPVLGGKNQGGPFVKKIGSVYWLWCHTGTESSILPSQLSRYYSSDLVTWVEDESPTLARVSADEGFGTLYGQIADPFLIEVNNSVYLYYHASVNGASSNDSGRIKLAVANLPFSELVKVKENESSDAGYPKPDDLKTLNIKTNNILGSENALNIVNNSDVLIASISNNGNSFFNIFNVTSKISNTPAITINNQSTYSEIQTSLFNTSYGGDLVLQRQGGNIRPTLRVFANDVAADADATLTSGSMYKVTGSRVIYQKP